MNNHNIETLKKYTKNNWLPFTPNRYFDNNIKILSSAQGAYYTLIDGRKVFDTISGLWCCALGHSHPKIIEAVTKQISTLDYATAFQFATPGTLELSTKIAKMAPEKMKSVFFVNSGSEAVDTALKITYGYHRLKGEASRTRFIGRERGYHGVGFGGTSVGGIPANRKMFGPILLNGVDHLPHTYDISKMSFTKGQPQWGAHLADELQRIVALHDASTIAAVIVEPIAGSTGVLVPPIGYLEKLREICTQYGILLIFDEVITGFGRYGKSFAAERLGVTPDIITFAKGVTNGVIPMGGVIVKDEIYKTFMDINTQEHMIELFHGYTYSGHPMASAAGNATIDLLIDEGYIEKSFELESVLEESVHSLKGTTGIIDIRNFGLTSGIDLDPIPNSPGLRALKVFEKGLDEGLLLRTSGDTIAIGPPFISTHDELYSMGEKIKSCINYVFSNY